MNLGSEFLIALQESFYGVFESIVFFVPNIFVALILFVAGWFLASWIGKMVAVGLGALKINELIGSTGVKDLAHKAGFNLHLDKAFGLFVKWVLIIVVATVSFDIVGLSQINDSLIQILGYVPNIIVAAVVLMITALIADFVEKVSAGSARAAGVKNAGVFGMVARWFVWIVGITTALSQLQVAAVVVVLFQSVLTGLVAAVALALGIAFGLGGKDVAARYLTRVEKELE